MPAPAAAIVTFITLVPPWVVNVNRAGALYTGLPMEREELKELRELKQNQLVTQRAGSGNPLAGIPGIRLSPMAGSACSHTIRPQILQIPNLPLG